MALACLYCSADDFPKMCWYSASEWEHHTHKHIQDNLLIHLDDPAFYQHFCEVETLPATSKLISVIPQTIWERAKAAKQFLEEGDDESTHPLPEVPVLGSCKTPSEIPKCQVKQDPIKTK